MTTRTTTTVTSVTYVVDGFLTIFEVLSDILGMSRTYLDSNKKLLKLGFSKWLESKHLNAVYVEFIAPHGLQHRCDFRIKYSAGDTVGFFNEDLEGVRYLATKLASMPAGSQYRVVVDLAPGAQDVDGWSSTNLRSVTNLSKGRLGTALNTPGIKAQMEYWTRR